jgi:hypothetical protein
MWPAILWGAGLGALGGLLTGNDPLKGAVVGGATGGLLNGIPAGTLSLEPAKIAASGAPTGMGVSLAPVASNAPLSFSLAPDAVSSGAGINLSGTLGGVNAPYTGFASGATGELGANMAFSPYRNIGMTTSADIAGKGSIDNLAKYATGSGADIMAKDPSMWDKISPYMNVRDLTGAAMVGAQYQQRPQLPTAPSGGVSRGQAPQGTDVMALLQTIKQPEKKRISLV